ncbi:hypothetical protein [Burkholderia sp. PR2]|uniref:hypothetical protein n=1 Tax=Burkholderia sp. PR2 TaxID=3448078 RepID=UPI00402AD804
MTAANAEVRLNLSEEGRRINRDLVEQINAMVQGEHAQSECFGSGRPMVVECIGWCIFGAILWMATLYAAS